MPQGRPLYRCVAGVGPNNLKQTESESVLWLWSNLPSSKIPPGCYLRPSPEKSAKSWVLMPQGRPLYRYVAGVEPNNLPQTELESVMRLWSNLRSSKVPPACYLRPSPEKLAKSWALMPQGRPLYCCVAGVGPNNLQQTESESVSRLWSNLPSSKIPPACYLRPSPEKSAKSWVLMPQGRPLYRCVAGVEPNNPPQTELESVMRLWSNLPSSKFPPACYLSPPPEMSAKSWVLMPQRRPLYRCVAGVEPNNLQQTESESVQRLWSNPLSSKIPPGCIPITPWIIVR